jgi:hypothetical protein
VRAQVEVADIINRLGEKIEKLGLNSWQLRTLHIIKKCRTAALGGHIDACDDCGIVRISYNSCRNGHCPKCQGKNREDWITKRTDELLPVPYFHVVFTLPDSINPLSIHQPKLVYDTLFDAAWETLAAFGKNKGLKMGMIAVLHTWGQNLSLHPHLHCIVPGGGVDKAGNWQNIRADGKFLFSVKAMSLVFRAKYCQKLKERNRSQYENIRQSLWKQNWVIYAKKPFGNADSVVEYLGRYSHKIAISNNRLLDIDSDSVTFSYKDYRQQGVKKQMKISQEEFIRRFALHILPKRFVKIRHYGFLSSSWKREKLKRLQKQLGIVPKVKTDKEKELPICSSCGHGRMHIVAVFHERGPPIWLSEIDQNAAVAYK